MPMLPWPIWPLAWQARLGQNTVVGSTAVLLILAVKWIHRSMLGSPFASQWRPTTVRCGATHHDALDIETQDYSLPRFRCHHRGARVAPSSPRPRPSARSRGSSGDGFSKGYL